MKKDTPTFRHIGEGFFYIVKAPDGLSGASRTFSDDEEKIKKIGKSMRGRCRPIIQYRDIKGNTYTIKD